MCGLLRDAESLTDLRPGPARLTSSVDETAKKVVTGLAQLLRHRSRNTYVIQRVAVDRSFFYTTDEGIQTTGGPGEEGKKSVEGGEVTLRAYAVKATLTDHNRQGSPDDRARRKAAASNPR